MGSVTVSNAVDQFLEYAAAVVAPSTLAVYRRYLQRLVSRFGAQDLAALTPAQVRMWDGRFHPLQAAKRLTRWAYYDARLVQSDPLAGLKKGHVGRRLRTLSRGESIRLLKKAKAQTRQIVLALRETFARPHELRRATWNDVRTAGLRAFTVEDLVDGTAFFFLEEFKGKAARRDPHAVRVIPISKRLGRLLERLLKKLPIFTAEIFRNHLQKPWTHNALRCAFRRLRVRAGIGPDYRGENVVAYTLRHTSATAAIVAGVPLAELAGAMGHSDVRMTSRYVHLSPAFLAQVHARIRGSRKPPR